MFISFIECCNIICKRHDLQLQYFSCTRDIVLKDNYYDLFLWLYNFYNVALMSIERWFSTQHITCLSRSPRILIIQVMLLWQPSGHCTQIGHSMNIHDSESSLAIKNRNVQSRAETQHNHKLYDCAAWM